MKVLKITNVILFCAICCVQAFALYLGVSMLLATTTRDGGALLGAVLGLLPIFLIDLVCLLILTTILTITSKKYKKKLLENNLPASKFATICKILPWCFILIDLIIGIIFFVMPK